MSFELQVLKYKMRVAMTEKDGFDESNPYFTPTLILPPLKGEG
jgi:hypothetical protein